MAVLVPLLINTVLNVRVFTRRIQPQSIDIVTNTNNNQQQQQPRISRRDILLLKQMIFMFCTFITGWTPVYSILIFNQFLTFDSLIFQYSVIFCRITTLAITINFFISNHEIKEYLINQIRQCVGSKDEN